MGVSLDIKPRKSAYETDALPSFDLAIKNDGSEPALVCTYMLDYRLRASMVAESLSGGISYELNPFRSWSFQPFEETDLKTLAPGETYPFQVDLSDTRGFGFVQRHSQPPSLGANMIVKKFEPGRYLVRVALSEKIALYVGQDGLYDRRLDVRQMPAGLPGGTAAPDLVKGFIEGEVELAWR